MKQIQLYQGRITTVDDVDYRYLMQWTWYYHDGYAARPSDQESGAWIYMHKVILHRMSQKPMCNVCGKVQDGTCECITQIFCIEKGRNVDCKIVEEFTDEESIEADIFMGCIGKEKCFDYSQGNYSFLIR